MTSLSAIFQGFYHEYQSSLFIARDEAITCVVNGARRYSVDLLQGGLIKRFLVSCYSLHRVKLLHVAIIQINFVMNNVRVFKFHNKWVIQFFNIESFPNYGTVHMNVAIYICNISDMTDTNFYLQVQLDSTKVFNSLMNIIVKFNLE